MKILVINAGSSSLKYQLIDMDGEHCIAKGLCEKIGISGSVITHKVTGGATCESKTDFPTHKEAFKAVVDMLTSGEGKVIDSLSEVGAIGHRTVHGGEKIKQSILVDDHVIDVMNEYAEFATLHNPPEAAAIQACREVFGENVPNVAVFDTAFHQTMPPKAYVFPIPYEYYEKQQIRRYGFHGTSHRYVSARYFELFGGRENSKIITCHLGNGSSLAAIMNGESVDTSMGFTPLDGFIMGTRSGGVDPSVITYIMEKENMSPDEMSAMLNKKSGFEGISGVSSDCRDLHAAAEKGDKRAALALELLVYGIKKYIGAYAAAMGGVDAVIFTGGIGENDDEVRCKVCEGMEFLGLKVDNELCRAASRKEAVFSTDDSRVRAMVLPTDEEIMIARDTLEIVSKL